MSYSVPIEQATLMFITDRHRSAGRGNKDVVRAALEGGCRWVQYREPDLSDRDFYHECLQIRQLCEEIKAGLIVNDRLDVAALVRADGVHLGKSGLPVRVVKEYMGEDFLVGFSAHDLQEAVTAAWEGADYITLSPIFPLSHKGSPFPPLGIKGALEVIAKVNIPVFLLGGIKLSHLPDLAGQVRPPRVAAVSMISEAEDPVTAVEDALAILEKSHS